MQLSIKTLVLVSNIFRKFLFCLDEEKAHNLALELLSSELIASLLPQITSKNKMLEQELFGIKFKNPIGLAAGFDKNAAALKGLSKFGFGFLEAGTVTKFPQEGNPKPRIFRLKEDEAIINALGFNNQGSAKFIGNCNYYKNFLQNNHIILGINIGKNKISRSNTDDYIYLIEQFYDIGNYITVNISSPNTPGLRDLQAEEALEELLSKIYDKRLKLAESKKFKKPILIKLAPDLEISQLQIIAEKVIKYDIQGVIISNTTTKLRNELKSSKKVNFGGLSGRPLFDLSNQILSEFYKLTKEKVPIIGVGGISSANDAFTKIKLGASLVQIYSAFIYEGFTLVNDILNELPLLLKQEGFNNIHEAVGTLHK